MNKLLKKIIVIIISAILLIGAFYNVKAAGTFVDVNLKNDFEQNSPIQSQSDKLSGNVISVVRIVAVAIAMIMLLVLAMRYMTSAPGDRADIKKHMIAYVVGAFIIFGGSLILGILVDVAKVFDNQ